MDPWGQKECVSQDVVNSQDLVVTERSSSTADMLIWDQRNGSHGFVEESEIREIGERSLLSTFVQDACYDKGGTVGNKVTPSIASSHVVSLGEEFGSKFVSSITESKHQDSSLIKLKLGRIADDKGFKSFKLIRGSSVMSLVESATPPKRTRSAELGSKTFFCQVLGCNKDLSSSKEYHKRHRVCDAHSKTALVIVNGFEQRFCQQCSRFHLLAEFDEGKRSCRRRLAGHNQRRRKPNLGHHLARDRKFQSYDGGSFKKISFAKVSYTCDDIFRNDDWLLDKFEANDWSQSIRVEIEEDYSKIFAFPPENSNLHPKNHVPEFNVRKQYPCLRESGTNTLAGSFIIDTVGSYARDVSGLHCSDPSPYNVTSFKSQDSNVFHPAPNQNGFSSLTSPGALSLLSSQSHSSSSYSIGKSIAQTSSITGNLVHHGITEDPGSNPQGSPNASASVTRVSHNFASPSLSPDLSNFCLNTFPEDNYAVNIEEPELFDSFGNETDSLSCEDGLTTINLLELSSQLHRVEHQKQSLDVFPNSYLNAASWYV